MKLLANTGAVLAAAFFQVTSANFDLYRVDAKSMIIGGNTEYGWQIFPSDPNCDEVRATPWYGAKSDVSGGKLGVRCEGNGCNEDVDPGQVNVLEMHFSNSPLYHFTIYKDRGYDMIGLDGKTYGNCIVFPSINYRCSVNLRTDYGFRKFRCLTSITSDQITGAH